MTQSACLSQGQANQLLDCASIRPSIFPFRSIDVLTISLQHVVMNIYVN
jgi:hypothetical protein